jgi:hypothetical protein
MSQEERLLRRWESWVSCDGIRANGGHSERNAPPTAGDGAREGMGSQASIWRDRAWPPRPRRMGMIAFVGPTFFLLPAVWCGPCFFCVGTPLVRRGWSIRSLRRRRGAGLVRHAQGQTLDLAPGPFQQHPQPWCDIARDGAILVNHRHCLPPLSTPAIQLLQVDLILRQRVICVFADLPLPFRERSRMVRQLQPAVLPRLCHVIFSPSRHACLSATRTAGSRR